MGQTDQGVSASEHRWQVIPRTLCFVTHGNDVLLLKGAADKRIWPGKYNGVGGHVERNETILQAARREIREETGLEVTALTLKGIVNIDAGPQDTTGIGLFVFTAKAPSREVTSSHEGTLEWHPVDDLPQTQLVEDLTTLLPRALNDNEPLFFARYWYDDSDQLRIEFTQTHGNISTS